MNREELIEHLREEIKALKAANLDLQIHFDTMKAELESGLRGEVGALQSMITDLSKAGIRMRAERDNQAQRTGVIESALEFACKSLSQVTSSDGSGHADIAVSALRMAGRKEDDALQIVEDYKASAKWRINAAPVQ